MRAPFDRCIRLHGLDKHPTLRKQASQYRSHREDDEVEEEQMRHVRTQDARRTSRRMGAVALVIGLCAGVAACGSSTKSSSTTSASSGTASAANASAPVKFTGAPIVVTTMTGVNTTLGSFPQLFAGVTGAARAINANGGINGHQLVVHTCNTNSTPSGELDCANEAISNGSIATVGDFVYTNYAAVESALAKAGIAQVANYDVTPAKTTFPIVMVLGNKAACLDPAFIKLSGAKAGVGVVLGLAGSGAQDSLDRTMGKNLSPGFPIKSSVAFAGTTSDFAPIVARLKNSGANLLILNDSSPTTAAIATTAASLGEHYIWCGDFGGFTGKTVIGLRQNATGFYEVDYFPPPTASAQYPILKTFNAQMQAEQAAGDSAASLAPANYLGNMLNSWLGVQIVKQAVQKIHGPITKASFLAAMNQLQPDLGGLANVDFAKQIGTGNYARIFNPYVTVWYWDPTKQNWVAEPSVHANGLKALGSLKP
jgi:ABC-type branched-subunit amino acid transport system substrate-binding protein